MKDTTGTVGVRELRQNLSVYLRRVKQGERLEVTERGQPVAELAPLRRKLSRRDQMIADGTLRPATESIATLPPPLKLSKEQREAFWKALEEQREERLP